LREVRAGRFAEQLRVEEESGYPLLKAARERARRAPSETAFERLAGTRDGSPES
jgi:ketol-acid reductoisomerase